MFAAKADFGEVEIGEVRQYVIGRVVGTGDELRGENESSCSGSRIESMVLEEE